MPASPEGIINLGTLPKGKVLDHVIIVTNTGGTRVERMGPNALSPPFSYAGEQYPGTGGDCDFGLDARAKCKIVIRVSGTNSAEPTDDAVEEATAYDQDLELEYSILGFGILGKASVKLQTTLVAKEEAI